MTIRLIAIIIIILNTIYSNGKESCDMQKRLLNAYNGNGRGQGEVGQRAMDSATRQETEVKCYV